MLDSVLVLLFNKLLDLNLLAGDLKLGGLSDVAVDKDVLENLIVGDVA